MGDLNDTIQDLVMDTLGASTLALGLALNLFKRADAKQTKTDLQDAGGGLDQ